MTPPHAGRAPITLALCGDVMLGRGLDQLLAHPSGPGLREAALHDARDYVALVERLRGPLPRSQPPEALWGEALDVLARAAPDVRLVNLETSVTTSEAYWPDKGIHYRLHPANVAALTCAQVDACTLANNHVLDFGRAGLRETLDVLAAAGVRTTGAGREAGEAAVPARVALREGGTLRFLGVGAESSGIAPDWAAGEGRPGVALLPDLSAATARAVAGRAAHAGPGDLAVVSVHWGDNWVDAVPAAHVAFAHALVDAGVDVVHGHSSHHPLGIEVYRGRLVLYGCGDFLNDYEGIRGYEAYRSDLRLLFLARLQADGGALQELRLVPFEAWRLSLRRASAEDVRWLEGALGEAGRPFGTRVEAKDDGTLTLRWEAGPGARG